MGPTIERVRDQVFLTTKSTERRAEAAWRELNKPLELLRTDHIDLWQVHAVNSLPELDAVFAPGGAIEAFVRAKDEGIASWIGITGHTEQAPVVHAEGLRRHDFDSVLTPVNYHQYTADDQFRVSFDRLYELVEERNVALRTIKAIAHRPWDGAPRLATWYEPFTEAADIHAAISWVLGTFPYIAGLATARRDHPAGQGHRQSRPHGRARSRQSSGQHRRLRVRLRLTVAAQLTLAKKSGLNPTDVVSVLNVTDFKTPIYSGVGRRVIDGDYEKSFALKLLVKDLGLIQDFGREVGVELPAVDITKQLAELGVAQGDGDLNASAVVKVISQQADVDVNGQAG